MLRFVLSCTSPKAREPPPCVTSVVVVLLVYPAIYYIWKGWSLKDSDEPAASASETLSASTSPDESASWRSLTLTTGHIFPPSCARAE